MLLNIINMMKLLMMIMVMVIVVIMMMVVLVIMTTTTMTKIIINVMAISGLIKLMATSRNWSELLWAWEGWRNVSGREMKSSYIKMVSLLNKEAKLQGKYG